MMACSFQASDPLRANLRAVSYPCWQNEAIAWGQVYGTYIA